MSNNQFKNCPALMSDGKIFATYESNQVVLDKIKIANGINLCTFDNNDMRSFLQRNAVKLMDKERSYIAAQNLCNIKTPKKTIVIDLPYAK